MRMSPGCSTAHASSTSRAGAHACRRNAARVSLVKMTRTALFTCAVAVTGCQSNPYVIGRFRDAVCDAHPDALVCSGFERPGFPDWTTTSIVGQATVAQTTAQTYDGNGALVASSTAKESTAVVLDEFPPITSGDLYLRVHLYVPADLPTDTMNFLFVGDYATPDPFKGIDFNLLDGAPQIYSPESAVQRSTSTTVVIPRDRWFCMQVAIGLSATDGTLRLDVDGVNALDLQKLHSLPAAGVHLLRAGIDWSSEQDAPFSIYMDDLVLDTTPIACDG
jgi:hypothetical protein